MTKKSRKLTPNPKILVGKAKVKDLVILRNKPPPHHPLKPSMITSTKQHCSSQ